MSQKLIQECYKKSVKLLLSNSNRYGVMASSVSKAAIRKNYIHIFGRDASICSLGMIASKNEQLVKSARNSLLSLAEHQTKLGQIPNSVNPEKKQVSFYHLGCIDATLWWLIAVDFYNKHIEDSELKTGLKPYVKKALKWLFYQDTNNCGLLEQGESCDWADDMPNNGLTLYTNVLWYWVLKLYGYKDVARLAYDGLNNFFLPHQANPKYSKYIKREKHRQEQLDILLDYVDDAPYYLHYISYRYASDRCDVYANLLAMLMGVAPEARAKTILRYLRNNRISNKNPVKVLFPPIEEHDEDWRDYMEREDCLNEPNAYHNGGIWPYIGGFWVMALYKLGKASEAEKELVKLAKANQVNDWEFNEWFHGKTGKPSGMPGQSWNAGTFLLAYHYLRDEISI